MPPQRMGAERADGAIEETKFQDGGGIRCKYVGDWVGARGDRTYLETSCEKMTSSIGRLSAVVRLLERRVQLIDLKGVYCPNVRGTGLYGGEIFGTTMVKGESINLD